MHNSIDSNCINSYITMSEEVLRSIEELSESESSNPIEEEVSKVAEILGATSKRPECLTLNKI